MCISGLLLWIIVILVIVIWLLHHHARKPIIIEVCTGCTESFNYPSMDINAAVLYAVYKADKVDYEFVKAWSKDIPFYIVNNGELTDYAEQMKQLPNVQLLERENDGWDIGAWKAGIDKWDKELSTYDVVAFVNNSMGYRINLKQILMFASFYDIYGLSENTRAIYPRHVQSTFIAIGKRLYNSDFFKEHWNTLKTNGKKHLYAVRAHEFGFSRKAFKLGYKIGVYDLVNGQNLYGLGNPESEYKREFLKKKPGSKSKTQRNNIEELLNKNVEDNKAKGYKHMA